MKRVAHPVLLNEQTAGYAWKPGAYLIAYGKMIDTQYFMSRDPQYANGIWEVEVDSGKTYELVTPQSGRPLVVSHWSPNGRFLGFDEVLYYESRKIVVVSTEDGSTGTLAQGSQPGSQRSQKSKDQESGDRG